MGLGLHGGGAGVAKFLAQAGAQVTVTDLKTKEELTTSLEKLKNLPIKFVLGRHEQQDFQNADLVIKNPGVPDHSPYLKIAQENQVPIDTDLGLFFQICPSQKTIGITGTKGKSTTTTLVHRMIVKEHSDAQIAGNIRISPFDILAKIQKNTPVVLELSSWQLEGLAQHKESPHIACITNLFEDHLNRYPDMQAYAEAKKNIFKFQKANDYVIMNYDNTLLRDPLFNLNLRNIYWFSRKKRIDQGTSLNKGIIILREKNRDHRLLSLRDIKIPGIHNLENVLAAVTTVWVFGIKRTTIQNVIKGFQGLPGRLKLIRELRGIKFINDTTSTTPLSTVAALEAFSEPMILIAGGADKNLSFSQLAKNIARKVKTVILLDGDATPRLYAKIQETLREKGQKLPIIRTASLAEAVQKAYSWAIPGDLVILSPACASFGMFVNEFERGDQFKAEVKKLK